LNACCSGAFKKSRRAAKKDIDIISVSAHMSPRTSFLAHFLPKLGRKHGFATFFLSILRHYYPKNAVFLNGKPFVSILEFIIRT